MRERLGLARSPIRFIATATGDLDPSHPVFREPAQPVVIAAERGAADRLVGRRFPSNIGIERLQGTGKEALVDLVDVAARHGAGLVVSEAGPHLFGQLLAADRVDELFLTVAPQLAGRADTEPRLGLIEGVALWPASPRWTRLASVSRAGDHLFLRYRFEETR